MRRLYRAVWVLIISALFIFLATVQAQQPKSEIIIEFSARRELVDIWNKRMEGSNLGVVFCVEGSYKFKENGGLLIEVEKIRQAISADSCRGLLGVGLVIPEGALNIFLKKAFALSFFEANPEWRVVALLEGVQPLLYNDSTIIVDQSVWLIKKVDPDTTP